MIGARLLLGTLCAIALPACDLPRLASLPLSLLAFAWGAQRARAEWRRHRVQLAWQSGRMPTIDGLAAHGARLQWRGPLAFLCWVDADGRRRVLDWWPDTLAAPARRELRLASAASPTAQPRTSMAP